MITTSTLWLDGSLVVLAIGLVLGALMALTAWDRHRQARAAAALHVPQHRALTPAPVEVIRRPFPMDEATSTIAARYAAIQAQERTEEMPRVETPVVHVEAAEQPPEEGAIGTVAAEESPEMADAAWRHEHDQRWTALLVGWASRPDWLSEFGADSLALPEYRRLVLEHTGEISMADLIAAGAR